MLTVAKMGGGRAVYYTTLSAEDYYVGRAYRLDERGEWTGAGAERLLLSGRKIETETFKNLFHGFSEDGKRKLVTNAGLYRGSERDRMPGFDLTFSAVKSVSIAWALGSDETRTMIEEAGKGAVRKTIAEIETFTEIRSGAGGRERHRCGIIAGVFQHGSARQVDKETLPDMQLHWHVTVINTGVTGDGRTGALKGIDFLNETFAKEYGALFRAHYGEGLTKAGFSLYRTRDGFEISGVPGELIEECSKRSRQIEAVAPRETSSAKEKLIAANSTKMAKGTPDPEQIISHWQMTAQRYGFTRESVEALRQSQKEQSEEAPHRGRGTKETRENYLAIADAARELSAEKVEFTRTELLARAYDTAAVRGISAGEVRTIVDDYLKSEALKFREKGSRSRYFTGENEASAERGREVRERGRAAAVKNLAAVRKEIEREGFRPIGVSLTKAKVEVMREAGMEAVTAARLLSDLTLEKKTSVRRRIYAEYKYATHQWSRETKEKYLGEYHKPQSRLVHEIKYATWQISRKQRDHLNRELEREKRVIDQKTAIVINEGGKGREADTIRKLIGEVQSRGGRVVFLDAEGIRQTERTERQEEKTRAQKAEQPGKVEEQQRDKSRERER